MTYHVLVTDYAWPTLDIERKVLSKIGAELIVPKEGSQDELAALAPQADAILVNWNGCSAKVVAAAQKCVIITRYGVGVDNIDTAAATERGIIVANVPDYCMDEVSNEAMAMLLAGARRLVFYDRAVRNKVWAVKGGMPFPRVRGLTLGIIGFGRIGKTVAPKAQAFGLRLLVCDPYIDERQKGALAIERTYSLEEVLQQADIVTLHTPLNEETKHMIGAPQLRMMKPTAHLINTARGGVINTPALEQALREKWIAGAGIDVYEVEPPPADMELFQHESATLSAHLGWCSVEAGWDIRYKIMNDIKACLRGEPPANTVNTEIGEVLGGRVYREV